MRQFHSAFETIKEQDLEVIHANGYLLRHKKTGATVALVSNDDDNKVFYIGFRTPPTDSTGVAHIIEHTVLCGSDKYPLKDPFVELVKGSMNTFINAMTYPDKTVYPVASTNEKDFNNLMDVYMDAVFNPNIYKYPEVFKQEGWHYEMTEPDGEITINGVVYNEMKGAFSSPDDVLERQIMASLFPDTTYAIESGGDPDVIPTLTREAYLDFHRKYYHPSNSFIYLYGDMDMEERLDYLDKEYLSKYDKLEIDSTVHAQPAFDTPVDTDVKYSVNSDDDTADKSYLSMNYSIGKYDDMELISAFSILDYALLSSPGAPLERALHEAGIGEDISGGFDSGTIQPVFSIIAKNTDLNRKKEFENIICDTLKDVVKKGIDKNVLLAGIEINKFRFLESDFGSFPKGLIYGLGILDTWLYDKNMPFDTLETVKYLDGFRDHLEDGYFEALIEKYLINNNHYSVVSISPEPGLTNKKDEKLKEELRKYKSTLSEKEIKELIKDTSDLKRFQEEPTPEEDLRKIPMLKREDLRREARPLTGKNSLINGINVMNNDIETNGIQYVELTFLPKGLTIEDVPAVSLYSKIIGMVDTENYSYGELTTRINVCSGGISTDVRTHGLMNDTSLFWFSMKAKMLYENSAEAEKLMTEILFHSKFDDKKRILEIIQQEKVQMEGYLISSGHSAASLRAGSYFSSAALIGDHSSGITYFRYLQKFEADFDNEYDKLLAIIEKCRACVFEPSNLYINNIGRKEATSNIEEFVPELKDEILKYREKVKDKNIISDNSDNKAGSIIGANPGEFEGKRPINEGFKTAGQIQYVCRAGNFHNAGYKFNGTMLLLKVILGYDYFWINVRVKGGAYGCMSGFSKSGIMHFVSYRDPNLQNTVDIFETTDKYLEEFNPNDRTMTKYIIGTISAMDTPLTPNQQGIRNFLMYMCGYNIQDFQKERDAILNCQPSDIRALAPIVAETMKQGYICTIGNEEKLKESADLFESVESLI